MSSVALKKTILHSAHLRAGAKIVDFGGWEMPVNYGSKIEEHLITRTHCGIFDVSHMAVVDIMGAQAKDFLKKVLANDVEKLKVNGQALYSCLLNEHAGIIDDLIVYRNDPSYRIVINAGTAASDLVWLHTHAQAFDVQLIPRRSDLSGAQNSLGMIAVQGPKSADILCKTIPSLANVIPNLKPFHAITVESSLGQLMIARTGYTGEDGFEIMISISSCETFWEQLIESGARPAGLGARDTLRLEAGMNLYGQDMSDQTNPLDAGLGWTVDLSNPRDFIGREALQQYTQKFDFVGLLLLDKGVLRSHQKVQTPLGDGEITSGTFSPSLELSIGLARLPKGITIGSNVTVLIRDKTLQARIVKPHFVRKGKSLIN